jgi:hypothetical protein
MREINPPSLKTIMTRQKAATGKTLGLGKAVSAENVQSLIDNGVRVHCMLHCIHYLWNWTPSMPCVREQHLSKENLELMESEANKNALHQLEADMVEAEARHKKRVQEILQSPMDPTKTIQAIMDRSEYAPDPDGAAEAIMTKSDILDRLAKARLVAEAARQARGGGLPQESTAHQARKLRQRGQRLDKLAGVYPLSPSTSYARPITRSMLQDSSSASSVSLLGAVSLRSPSRSPAR